MKLHYAGPPGEGYGWGVCNANLKAALGNLFELTDDHGADIVFMQLADHDFNPLTPARGSRLNLAYTFFEYPLGPAAAANAAKYDVVFCGSSWCLERLRECGIVNGRVLIQGVDHAIFEPLGRVKDWPTFRIFSGGKFEFRKGQDLVIAAFREFARMHPDAYLICSWFNIWPETMSTMRESPHIRLAGEGGTQEEFLADLLVKNGIARERFAILPPMAQEFLAQVMNETDVGLFPNRCEGGTNLVLMEYLACGKPAIANLLTGHADLNHASILPIEAREDRDHWAEQTVEAVIEALESAYARRDTLKATPCTTFTWARAAAIVQETVLALESGAFKPGRAFR